MSIDAISAYGVDFSAMRARFQQADADKSGGLSLEEFEQAGAQSTSGAADPAGQAAAGEMFALLDADANGELSADEVSSALNGSISSDSFMSLLAAQEAAQESAAASGVDASAARSQLTATYGSQEGAEDDLLGDLLDSLDEDTDEEEDIA